MSLRPHVSSQAAPGVGTSGWARRARVRLLVSAVVVVAIAAAVVLVAGTKDPRPTGSHEGVTAANDRQASAELRAARARTALDALVQAWDARDRARFVSAVADRETARRWATATWHALVRLDVRRLDLHYPTTVPGRGSADDSSAVVDVTWTQAGWATPATTQVTVDVADTGQVLSAHPKAGSPAPLWALGPARVASRPGSTLVVLPGGGGAGPARLSAMVARARAQVDDVVPAGDDRDRWGGPLVVVAPGSTAGFSRVLGRPAGDLAGVAAVTTTVDGSVRADAPAQVVLNPAVFDSLAPLAAQVVLTHEATHAATGAAAVSMPLWVAEGFADYVALHDSTVPLRLSARLALAAARRHGPPSALPRSADFAVGAHGLGRAYEEAWLAFRLLGRRHGTAAAVAFYDAVRAGRRVDTALRRTTGSGLATMTAQWRAELARLVRVQG